MFLLNLNDPRQDGPIGLHDPRQPLLAQGDAPVGMPGVGAGAAALPDAGVPASTGFGAPGLGAAAARPGGAPASQSGFGASGSGLPNLPNPSQPGAGPQVQPLVVPDPDNRPNPLAAALAKISLRERVMVAGLLLAAVIAGSVFFGILPAMESISSLDAEIGQLNERKALMQGEIMQADSYRQQMAAATTEYDFYKGTFYAPMTPEDIDRLITSQLLDCGLEPVQLDMTALEQASISWYQPAELVPSVLQQQVSNAGGSEAASGLEGSADSAASGTEGSADSAAEPSAGSATDGDAGQSGLVANANAVTDNGTGAMLASSAGAAAEVPNVYASTIMLVAECESMDGLYAFLESTRGNLAQQVISYSWNDPNEGFGLYDEEYDDEAMINVTMQLRLYFYSG